MCLEVRQPKTANETAGLVTVCFNLNATTVALRKNGAYIKTPQEITRDEIYRFAIDVYCEGNGVMKVKESTNE